MKDRGPWFETYTGIKFHFFDPYPCEIELEDIIQHLSVITRFGGALGYPYSVAQHSLIISHLVRPEYALAGLLHDAAESYIGDFVSPFKQAFPSIIKVENRILRIIAEKFCFPYPLPKDVKSYDKKLTKAEAEYFGMDTKNWVDPVYRESFLTDSELSVMYKFMEFDYKEIQELFRSRFWYLSCLFSSVD